MIEALGLIPHPEEGGFFRETYRSSQVVSAQALARDSGAQDGGSGYDGDRCVGTAIYYLLTPDTFSALHRLKSDEIFHFYSGDPVEMLHLHPDGRSQVHHLGSDVFAGQHPQLVVPQGVWQGARLMQGGAYALLGCTVSPGFEFVDYDHGQRDTLLASHPDHADLITALTTTP